MLRRVSSNVSGSEECDVSGRTIDQAYASKTDAAHSKLLHRVPCDRVKSVESFEILNSLLFLLSNEDCPAESIRYSIHRSWAHSSKCFTINLILTSRPMKGATMAPTRDSVIDVPTANARTSVGKHSATCTTRRENSTCEAHLPTLARPTWSHGYPTKELVRLIPMVLASCSLFQPLMSKSSLQ